MSYEKALERMRKEKKQPEAVVLPRTSLISPRQGQAPKQADDPLALTREWMGMIREAAAPYKKQASELYTPKVENTVAPVKKAAAPAEEPEAPPQEKRRSLFSDDALEGGGGKVYGGDIGSASSLRDLIDATEGAGRYDTLYGHSQRDKFAGVDITKMTLDELKGFTSASGDYAQFVKSKEGRVATPLGRYQFVGRTLAKVADDMGLPGNTVFSKDIQDKMFDFHVDQVMAQGDTLQEKVSRLRNTWVGLKKVPTAQLVSIVRRMA